MLHCYEVKEQQVHFYVDEIKLYIKQKSFKIILNEKHEEG